MKLILLRMFIDGERIGFKQVYNMPRQGDIIQLSEHKFAKIERIVFSMDESEPRGYDTILLDLKAI